MKKIMYILLFSFCILMFKINSINALNDIEIKEVSIVEKSNNATIDISSFNGLAVNMDLMLHNLDEYVTYKIVLKNNTSNDYEIESIKDNNDLEYITNTYEVVDKNFNSKSEIELLVTTKCTKRIPTYKEEFNQEIKIEIKYNNGESTIIEKNPNTSDSINKYLVIFVLFFIVLLSNILFKYKIIKCSLLVIELMILMPSVRALVVSISINNNMNLTLYAGTYLNNEIINKSNDVDIEYSDDTKSEAFKFEHPSTEQTTELVDYRYIGDNPNNYIYFNCTDSEDISTCELWRILGVFDVEDENGNIETRTKIIPNYSFYLMWDEENVNEWITSTGKRYLNDGEFWNKLSSTSKSMISPTKYYLGNSRGIANNSADGIYTEERSLNTEFNRSVNWVGNIGIIYPSDYGYMYSKGASSSCENNILSCYNEYSWLNEINDEEWTWTITPKITGRGYAAIAVNVPSYIGGGAQVYCYFYVNPTAYLSKNVYAIEGNGSKDKPYRIRMDS